METFRLLQRTACDERHGGYSEAAAPDWSKSAVSALGDGDIACAKSMNTNLHVLEAFTALHEATGDAAVARALRGLIEVFLSKILTPSAHLGLFFDNDWSRLDAAVSYGHDIEASWLLTEAAERTGDEQLGTRVRKSALAVAAGIAQVLDAHQGSLPNELKEGRLDTDRIWWVQAEGIVGMVNAAELSGDSAYLRRASALWGFVKAFLIDRAHGEWFWGVRHPGGALLPGPVQGRRLEGQLSQRAGVHADHEPARAGERGRRAPVTTPNLRGAQGRAGKGKRRPGEKKERACPAGERHLHALPFSGPHGCARAPGLALRFRPGGEPAAPRKAAGERGVQRRRDQAE